MASSRCSNTILATPLPTWPGSRSVRAPLLRTMAVAEEAQYLRYVGHAYFPCIQRQGLFLAGLRSTCRKQPIELRRKRASLLTGEDSSSTLKIHDDYLVILMTGPSSQQTSR